MTRRILLVHNGYQVRGGEDVVVEQELQLLRDGGYEVETFFVHNEGISGLSGALSTALTTAQNWRAARKVAEAVRRFRPDVVHAHNVFPQLSPAIFAAARKEGAATVLTLHNYRFTCAGGLLLREGKICETCVTGSPFWAAVRRCYRGSFLGSFVVAEMIARHRRRGTWLSDVDRFITLSEFARSRMALAGFPFAKMVVRPNMAPDPGPVTEQTRSGFLFVGRLSEEKGLRVLLEAARLTNEQISVLGDGPLEAELRQKAPANLVLLGRGNREAVHKAMAGAKAVVIPSICYEGFPLTMVEAFAAGTPVIASRMGALAEWVRDGENGLSVPTGDAQKLAEALTACAGHQALDNWGKACRSLYETHFSAPVSLVSLAAIYEEAIAERAAKKG